MNIIFFVTKKFCSLKNVVVAVWFLSLVITNKWINSPLSRTTSIRLQIRRSKIYIGLVTPISYIPFGLSEPRRVPMPPANKTAPTLPERIADRPVSRYLSSFAWISCSLSARIGVIVPVEDSFSLLPILFSY